MLLTNNHFTPVIGIDLHFNTLPPWNPIHPYIGIVLDPFDYLPFLGGTTYVNGIMRGISDTSGRIITIFHIPLFTGPFVMTPIIGHESVNFFGSQNAYIEGRRISPKGYMKMTCNDIGIPLSLRPGKKMIPIPSLFAPTSFSLPIPTGPPVNINGPYVPDWTGALINLVASFGLGAVFKGLGKSMRKLNKLLPGNNAFTKGLKKNLCRLGFEPADLVTGRMVYEYTDFELPGPVPLAWERNYYSDSQYEGPLGIGHHHSYDLTLEVHEQQGLIGVVLPDGRQAGFELLKNIGDSTFNRSERLQLTKTPKGFELFDLDQRLTWQFAAITGDRYWCKPVRLQNDTGHGIDFAYQGRRLTEITDSSGRLLQLDYDGHSRITSVTFIAETLRRVLVQYRYDKNGNLVAVADTLQQETVMAYDQEHRMLSKTDRNGATFFWEYDDEGRCVHTYGEDGTMNGRIAYGDGVNEVTNSLGAVEKIFYNDDFLVLEEEDALGNSRFSEYTEYMEPFREIDEEANLTGYTYDERGNLESITYPDGSQQMYLYDEEDRLIIAVDPNGGKTIWNFDKEGKLISTTAADNSSIFLEYNEHKLVRQINNENGETTLLKYDDQHNLAAMELPDGGSAQWSYNALGQVRNITNPLGTPQNFSYDGLGRVKQIRQGDFNVVNLDYNAYDEVISAKDNHHQVSFEYTVLGSLKSRTENGVKVDFLYNREEQLVGIHNEQGDRYSFKRNRRGDIAQEIGFDGITRGYRRDRAGKVLRVQRPEEKFTDYEYDALGRIIRAEHSDGSWEVFAYDKNGQLTEAVNQDTIVQFQRDHLGRVLSETQGAGVTGLEQTVTSTFDKAGNRIGVKSSLGADIKFERNKLGAVTGIKAQQGEAKAWQAQIQRNLLGLEVERKMTGGVTSQWHYDISGRPTGHKVSAGAQTVRHRSYQWNANDRLHSMINQLTTGQTSYGHDAFGHLAWAKYEDGSYDYKLPDEVGNLYKTESRKDRTYGSGGRLLKDDTWTYTYDGEGNLIKKFSADSPLEGGQGGVHSYSWYGNGMLKKVVDGRGATTFFEYDALGRRTAKLHHGKLTRFIWDGNVPLHEWQYEAKERPEPVVDEYGGLSHDALEPVDADQLVTWVFEDGSFAPSAKLVGQQRYSIVTDYIGKPVQAYDDNGEVVWEVAYDIYGGVRKQIEGAKHFIPFRNQGQYEDAETGLFYNRFRYYDCEVGNYISQDPIGLAGGAPNSYAYVHSTNACIDIFGLTPSEIFTDSGGLTLEVKNQQSLSHLSDDKLRRLYHANNNPKGFGISAKNSNGETIILHHQRQKNTGPIIEIPRSAHKNASKKLHPHWPNPHPSNPVDRARFDLWRKEYWKHRAEKEVKARGIAVCK